MDIVVVNGLQDGECADLDAKNPYSIEDKKSYHAWKIGHDKAIEDNKIQLRWKNTTKWQKVKCKIGIHNFEVIKIHGRPHIDYQTGNIISRDRIITRFTCIYCNETCFDGLNG